ncbi:hypothetical protein GQ600_10588 [Phytophthora cactorum]|nr:hypothetical protein GQ600_10588 [Phytophthora cactorum]
MPWIESSYASAFLDFFLVGTAKSHRHKTHHAVITHLLTEELLLESFDRSGALVLLLCFGLLFLALLARLFLTRRNVLGHLVGLTFLKHLHLLLVLLGLLHGLAFVLLHEVLTTLDLLVHLAGRRCWWEWRVVLLLTDLLRLLGLHVLLLKCGQETFPVLIFKLGVLGQLTLDHEALYVVDRVHVGKALLHDLAHVAQTVVAAHSRHGVALHKHIAVGEQLNGFERGSVGAHKTLAALHEAFLVAHEAADLDDVHCTSSSRILTAWFTGILRASSLMRSRALSTMYGSVVLRVVRTVMLPSTRLSSHVILCASSALVTMGHTSRRYFSRYLGKSVANELSSSRPGILIFLPALFSSSTSSFHGGRCPHCPTACPCGGSSSRGPPPPSGCAARRRQTAPSLPKVLNESPLMVCQPNSRAAVAMWYKPASFGCAKNLLVVWRTSCRVRRFSLLESIQTVFSSSQTSEAMADPPAALPVCDLRLDVDEPEEEDASRSSLVCGRAAP